MIRLVISFAFMLALVAEVSVAGEAAVAPSPSNELERKVDILAQEIQKLKIGGAAEAVADQSQYGFGPAASKVYRVQSGFSIGGYGEILFESFRSGSGSPYGRSGVGLNQIDLKRVILYAGYKFNDEWVMNSELEWEHGGEEISVEFLYFDRFVSQGLNYRFGKILMPMGITNEIHEPVTFQGSHRPLVETLLIPSTWSEYGAGVFGDFGSGWTYRAYAVTGMNASGFTPDKGIREGRNESGRANATRFAGVGRMDYIGTPGLLAGGSVYIGEATPRTPSTGSALISVPMQIVETHAHYTRGAWDFKLMGTVTMLSNVAQLNSAVAPSLGPSETIGSRQAGGYFQVGYDLMNGASDGKVFMPFVRHEIVNTQAAIPAGYTLSGQTDIHATALGFNYKPTSQVVLKGDSEWFKVRDGSISNQFNLSVGYVF